MNIEKNVKTSAFTGNLSCSELTETFCMDAFGLKKDQNKSLNV